MKKQEFKAESKKLMDLMINSIYTNKEIFLREIISNASDAIDKLNYKALTEHEKSINTKNFEIRLSIDKNLKTLTISDNGIGMTKEELETNLGTIAKSGSSAFKEENEKKKDIDIIGQFGVGFYSCFMVAKKVKVISKSFNSEDCYVWESEGIDGFTVEKGNRENYGTDVILTLKDDTPDEKYSAYLEEYKLESIVKKYSDYITHPIKMLVSESKKIEDKEEYETKTVDKQLNSLTPLWKRNKSKIKDEEYNTFYADKFMDYEEPLSRIHVSAEGTLSYNALLFIPSHASYDYYTKEYEKGLQLYANGVLIMEKCSDLLPDYFSFIKGVVDSPDVSLNISREVLQQTKVLKTISSNLEKKIKAELVKLRDEKRDKYEQFYESFARQFKFEIYNNYGMNKDKIADLLLFYSSKEKKLISLSEYVKNMTKDQKDIYYACGETIDKIDMLPQLEKLKDKGFEILYCTDYMDEFVLKTLNVFEEKSFINIASAEKSDENEEATKFNEDNKDMLEIMKKALTDVDVKFTDNLTKHPVCLMSTGEITNAMEKALNAMPINQKASSNKVLEINKNHEIMEKLQKLYKKDKSSLEDYTKILYNQARLIEGLPIENPTEYSNLVCKFLA
jgi:molecular chaperone HtpG